ncbi:hypothetical protein Pmar_PMAR006782 [Perkinsus marinus ATCC 50983]|uniref:CBS domain-containing protein n=1 Tax=Perkinsus marinus (strain ATCC 50983 / TXsc) TaxID=423536 RepID=C5K6H0_PERM5|nr:hypothetical protein Pmar_PMAR006782 [Perkinsus marinus ATCC 50983]EER19890.1 hypothetical protein Pmar_PMAR006782 [Perkinsus marinus ATCC 50983]|eukprot:XP_002788094.1 hypothetical protein Pmar_PMAR006782 [Perkinsus marinus ATCC 50983]
MIPIVTRHENGGLKLAGIIPTHQIEGEILSAMKAVIPNGVSVLDNTIISENSQMLSQQQLAVLDESTPIGRAVDWNPLTVTHTMPTARVQYLFTMLRLHCLFVLDGTTHVLLGVVTKASFDISRELLPPTELNSRSSVKDPTEDDKTNLELSELRRRSLGNVVDDVPSTSPPHYDEEIDSTIGSI